MTLLEAMIVSAVVGIILTAQFHAVAHMRNLQALSNERASVVAAAHRVAEEIRAGVRPVESASATDSDKAIAMEVTPLSNLPTGIGGATVVATRITPEGPIRVELMVLVPLAAEEKTQ